jgi:integrase
MWRLKMKAVRSKKRKVQDEPIFVDDYLLDKLFEIVKKTVWPYRVNVKQLQHRDQALVCFLLLTGVRNSETQDIRKKQTRIYEKDILIVNVQPLKNGKLRNEIILPKTGGLAPFTEIFENWLKQVPNDENILFPSANTDGKLLWDQPLKSQRIHWIIKSTTGLFPHWFRGVCASLYGKQFFNNNLRALQDFMGVKNMNNLTPYIAGQWKQYEKNIYNAT